MKRARASMIVMVAALAVSHFGWAMQQHPVTGLVLSVDPSNHSFVVSCQSIPGYMNAMVMPFTVHKTKTLNGIRAGTTVQFTMVEDANSSYAEDIHVLRYQNFEQEPMEAARLKVLHEMLDPTAASKVLRVGQPLPDFAFTDQTGKKITFSQLAGKVVAHTFIYSRCPNPNYCFRLSNNLGRIGKRFSDRMGKDLVFLSIVIDPEHDQGSTLANYAGVWKANPNVWHFLTGSLPEVKDVSRMFGMEFWNDEGLLTHSFHTIVIDREGRLAANLEGNQFTAEQLGDLVQTVMERR